MGKKKQVLITEVMDYGTNASLHETQCNPLAPLCSEGLVKVKKNPLGSDEISEEDKLDDSE